MTPDAWRLAPGITLHFRWWDDACVVYFGGPGDTHLVDAVGFAVLQALAREPVSVDDLVNVVGRVTGTSDRDGARFLLADFLGQMSKTGLVDPVEW